MSFEFEDQWPRCKEWIEAALPYAGGTHIIEDIEAGLESGQYQFWPGAKSAMVTTIVYNPRSTELLIFLAGGDMGELKEFIEPAVTAWAKDNGCHKARIAGRKGWQRALSDIGYESDLVLLVKDL